MIQSLLHQAALTGKVVIGLFGAGGCARGVMPIVVETIKAVQAAHPDVTFEPYFVEREPTKATVNGIPLLSEEAFFALEADTRFFNVAIAESKLRQKITETCLARGLRPLSLAASQTICYDDVEVGEGAILCANTMLTSNIRIGKFFHANIYSYVEHDCVIGDYVTFAPAVRCNGNVHIGDHAYIGTGAILKQGSLDKPLRIGEGAIIGMGAVVTKEVPAHTTVVGNPARPMGK
ncbi:MAG: acetyltransferase [Alphaproteobacteria bacterium]|nr:acetyltransferase [Alphaproteobacteria bacterium]